METRNQINKSSDYRRFWLWLAGAVDSLWQAGALRHASVYVPLASVPSRLISSEMTCPDPRLRRTMLLLAFRLVPPPLQTVRQMLSSALRVALNQPRRFAKDTH